MRYALVICILIFSCYKPNPPAATFVDYTQSFPRTFDPARATDINSGKVLAKIHRALFRIDAEGKLVGELTAETKAAGLSRSYQLRPFVFPGGRQVTGYDVALSLLRVINKEKLFQAIQKYTPGWLGYEPALDYKKLAGAMKSSPLSSLYSSIEDIQPAKDSLTLKLKYQTGNLDYLLSMPVVYVYDWQYLLRHLAKSQQYATVLARPESYVGCGPYRLQRIRDDRTIVLTSTGTNKPPETENYIFRIIQEETSARFLFLKGELDILYPPPLLLGDLPRRYQAGRREILAAHYIAVNFDRTDLDLNFRRALNYAVDKTLLIEKALGGLMIPSGGPVPWQLLPDKALTPAPAYKFDRAAAGSALKDSTYKGRELELLVKQDSELITQARIIAGMAAEVGINIKVVPAEKRIMMQRNQNSDGDLFFFNWYADYPEAENFLRPLFHSSNKGYGGNRARLDDPAVDAALDELSRTFTGNKRAQLISQLNERLKDKAVWLFLWNGAENVIRGKRLAGYPMHAIYSGDRGDKIKLKSP